MCPLILCSSLLRMLLQSGTMTTINPLIIPGDENVGICPSQERTDTAIQNITASVRAMLQNYQSASRLSNCGTGEWHQVAHLNMSDPSQQCPSTWKLDNTLGIRNCRRPQSSSGSCPATFYTPGRQYSRVCGRAIGYQVGSTDAFGGAAGRSIDSFYVYGLSITHGATRNHIWTFAAGITEGGRTVPRDNCPCLNPSDQGNRLPPSFVGENYYCESGNPTSTYIVNNLYSSDPLWDGMQCEGQCCSNGKSPPWFSVNLANPTNDDIEVRICIPQGTFDDIAVQLLEVYVQ